MRLIDADALKAKIMIDVPGFMEGGSSITKAFIMAMLGSRTATPTIDAVPVVRCKDCKYGQYCTDGETTYQCFKWNSNEFGALHEQDWFCADGERRDTDA